MKANVGNLVLILPAAHGYPVTWVYGADPIRFIKGAIGILLEVKHVSYADTRVFYKIATHLGVISIYSGFTRVIN